MAHTIKTYWEVTEDFDVWGNEEEGFEVNESCSIGRAMLEIPVMRHNIGTPQEFKSAYPTNKQIRQIFSLNNVGIFLKGDDINITVELDTGYPIGQLNCVSHISLSPIRRDNSMYDGNYCLLDEG